MSSYSYAVKVILDLGKLLPLDLIPLCLGFSYFIFEGVFDWLRVDMPVIGVGPTETLIFDWSAGVWSFNLDCSGSFGTFLLEPKQLIIFINTNKIGFKMLGSYIYWYTKVVFKFEADD